MADENTVVEPQVEAAPESQAAPPQPPMHAPAPMAQELGFDDSSYADEGDAVIETETPAVEPASEPVMQASTPPAEETPRVEFPDELLSQAGVTAEQAAVHFGTPEALERAVRMLDARAAEAGRRYLSQMQPPAQPPAPPQPAQPQQPPAAVTPPLEQDEDWLPPPESGGDWDPDTKFLAKALQKKYQAELARRDEAMAQQQQMLAAIAQQRESEARAAYVHEFDGFIEGLGESWKTVFGVGSGWELPQQSPMVANRVHLDKVAAEIAAGFQLDGRPSLSRKELWNRALYVAFPEVQQQAVRKEVVQQVAQRQQQLTARPTQRRSAPMTAESRAAQAAEDWFKSKGMAAVAEDDDYSEV